MSATRTVLRAKDVMSAEPVCVEPSTAVQELVRLFEEYEISGAPVIDQQGRVIGVVSKTDLIHHCAKSMEEDSFANLLEVLRSAGGEAGDGAGEPSAEPVIRVEDIMTEDPLLVAPDVPVGTVARLLFQRRLHRVVVVDEERYPVGIITTLDLLRLIPHQVWST